MDCRGRLIIPRKMYRIRAIRSNEFNKRYYCYYRKNDILYVLGYNKSVYFTSTNEKLPFSSENMSGYVNANDFIVLKDDD
jgi:hypothetical protein